MEKRLRIHWDKKVGMVKPEYKTSQFLEHYEISNKFMIVFFFNQYQTAKNMALLSLEINNKSKHSWCLHLFTPKFVLYAKIAKMEPIWGSY